MSATKPLVLDVDGTFLRTDILFECFWAALGKKPVKTIMVCLNNFSRPAVLKMKLAGLAMLRTDLLPVNVAVKAYADQCRGEGREVILASASDNSLVAQLAEDHGFSDRIFASDGKINLKGNRKAMRLVAAFGEGGFDYAGNEPVDMAIWDHADAALVVGKLPTIRRQLVAKGKKVTGFADDWRYGDLIRALRPASWWKNILVFVPAVVAGHLTMGVFWPLVLGAVSFTAIAASIYIVRDLLNLGADRLHLERRKLPFASGAVTIRNGMLTALPLGLLAFATAAELGTAFFGVIAAYVALSLIGAVGRKKSLEWTTIATMLSLVLRVVAGWVIG